MGFTTVCCFQDDYHSESSLIDFVKLMLGFMSIMLAALRNSIVQVTDGIKYRFKLKMVLKINLVCTCLVARNENGIYL